MNGLAHAPLRGLATCKACGQSIVWAETTNRKRIPLNPQPTEDGNLALVRTGAGALVAIYVKPGDLPRDPRYTSHFATCPDAAKFRAPRKRSGKMRQS